MSNRDEIKRMVSKSTGPVQSHEVAVWLGIDHFTAKRELEKLAEAGEVSRLRKARGWVGYMRRFTPMTEDEPC